MPTKPILSREQRSDILKSEVARYGGRGWLLKGQADYQAQMLRPPHIVLWVIRRPARLLTLSVDSFGHVSKSARNA